MNNCKTSRYIKRKPIETRNVIIYCIIKTVLMLCSSAVNRINYNQVTLTVCRVYIYIYNYIISLIAEFVVYFDVPWARNNPKTFSKFDFRVAWLINHHSVNTTYTDHDALLMKSPAKTPPHSTERIVNYIMYNIVLHRHLSARLSAGRDDSAPVKTICST